MKKLLIATAALALTASASLAGSYAPGTSDRPVPRPAQIVFGCEVVPGDGGYTVKADPRCVFNFAAGEVRDEGIRGDGRLTRGLIERISTKNKTTTMGKECPHDYQS